MKKANEKAKMIRLGAFREDPDNVSEATDEEIKRLAGKLKRVPLGLTAMRIAYVTDAPGGGCMVISGNKRLRCLKAAFGEDGEVPAEWFQDITAMSEAERHEFRLNANVSDGHWNLEKLLAQYDTAELSAAGLDELLEGLPEADEATGGQTDEDAVPEAPETPVSRRGEVYQCGEHRLMCGDSTSAADVARLMDGGKADMILTDPPYGIDVVKRGKVGGDGATHFKGKVGSFVKSSFYIPVANDGNTNAAKEAIAIWMPKADRAIIFGGNYFTDVLHPSRCWIVWDKENTGNFADAELAWTNIDKGVKVYRFMWNGLARKGNRKEEGRTRVHPTQKPVGLFANIIQDFTESEARVLDAFLGSGTTVLACEKTGRVCYGMELDPHYCDVIRRRWAEFVHGEGCDWQSLTPKEGDR